MAECHPVGFRWVMEAKRRGARIIHIDPRFSRTSAAADLHLPIRAGSDIAFLGGATNYIPRNQPAACAHVLASPNAAPMLGGSFPPTHGHPTPVLGSVAANGRRHT